MEKSNKIQIKRMEKGKSVQVVNKRNVFFKIESRKKKNKLRDGVSHLLSSFHSSLHSTCTFKGTSSLLSLLLF